MLAILDYDAGNIESVRLALRHVGGEPVFVRDADAVRKAERIVFPGVGSAAQCMTNFRKRGFDQAVRDAHREGTPILAICIGMQLLFDSSEEDGGVQTLGILPGTVRKFVPPPGDTATKVPHMGWNRVDFRAQHPLLPVDTTGGDYYFVHSYYVEPAWTSSQPFGQVYGKTGYAGIGFTSMVGHGSLFAAQFHPEKSGETGLDMLRRFLQWDGRPC